MFDWLKPRPPESKDPDDWLLVPYRMVEVMRISLYVLVSHGGLPDRIREQTVEWLKSYDASVAMWLHGRYGAEAFTHVEDIFNDVKKNSGFGTVEDHTKELFERLEREMMRENDE